MQQETYIDVKRVKQETRERGKREKMERTGAKRADSFLVGLGRDARACNLLFFEVRQRHALEMDIATREEQRSLTQTTTASESTARCIRSFFLFCQMVSVAASRPSKRPVSSSSFLTLCFLSSRSSSKALQPR